MTVHDAIAEELDTLDVQGWQREMALRLAESVDDRGTASAAATLRSLMQDIAGEHPTGTGVVDAIRAKLTGHTLLITGRSRKGAEKAQESPKNDLIRVCIDCGSDLPAQTRGRPRIRCAGGCR